METTHNIGIWIDSQKAIIVSVNEKESILKKVYSGMAGKDKEQQITNIYRNGDRSYPNERNMDERHNHEIKNYLEDVVKDLTAEQMDKLVVFGPAFMKTELKKVIDKNKEVATKLVAVETADSMTDNQTIAWVKEYFNHKN